MLNRSVDTLKFVRGGRRGILRVPGLARGCHLTPVPLVDEDRKRGGVRIPKDGCEPERAVSRPEGVGMPPTEWNL